MPNPQIDFQNEVARIVGLKSDRTRLEGDKAYFYFDSPESWLINFQEAVGVRGAIVRAYMLGFRQYVFVRHDGREFPSSDKYWIPRDRGHLRGRSR